MKKILSLLSLLITTLVYGQSQLVLAGSYYPSFGYTLSGRMEVFGNGAFYLTPGFTYVIPKQGQTKDITYSNEATLLPTLQGAISLYKGKYSDHRLIIGQLGFNRSTEVGYGFSYKSSAALLQSNVGYNVAWGFYGGLTISIPITLKNNGNFLGIY